jgi:hypothetical protein
MYFGSKHWLIWVDVMYLLHIEKRIIPQHFVQSGLAVVCNYGAACRI